MRVGLMCLQILSDESQVGIFFPKLDALYCVWKLNLQVLFLKTVNKDYNIVEWNKLTPFFLLFVFLSIQ